MSGSEAADAVARGVNTVLPDAEISAFSVSDGGEGLTSSLLSVLGGTTKTVRVHDALGKSIDAEYGVIHDCAFVDGADLAVIELASASGLAGLKPEERDPEKASSKGSGELILAALKDGYRNFLIGLGGTATNDCGLGMLRALGFSFTDTDGKETCDGAAGLDGITDISDVKRLVNCPVTRIKYCAVKFFRVFIIQCQIYVCSASRRAGYRQNTVFNLRF